MSQFKLLTCPHYVFGAYACTLHSSLENKIPKNYLYLSKLETQMVTSTPSENLALRLYEAQNKTFKFGTTKTLILHTWSIFFKGGHLTKI
jgi:hypothetical protein